MDSKAANQAVPSYTTSKALREIHYAIKTLQNINKNIILHWTPSHVGLSGDDATDNLAKKGIALHQSRGIPCLLYTSRCV